MIAALQAVQSRGSSQLGATHSFTVDVIDIDQYPALEAKYGDKVPVLLLGNSEANDATQTEICHYFFDEAKLMAHLVHSKGVLE